jgi:hypothetical protein
MLNYYTILFVENEDPLGKARQPGHFAEYLRRPNAVLGNMKHFMHTQELWA